jgi:hypothetical protein
MSVSDFSRKMVLFFSLYITYAFALKYLPNSMQSFFIFLFLFLLNAGTQAACYHLMKFCSPWQERTVFGLQILLAAWSIYDFRFVYDDGYTGDHISTLLYTPLKQWGIIIFVILVVIFINTDRKK